jgi:transcriptional regulator with XRE-family HTH domain
MNRLKQLRKGKYTQDEMADALNVGRSTYTKYESGAIQMGADVLVRLSEIFKVSIDYILGRSDLPSPPEEMPISSRQFALLSDTMDFTDDELDDLNAQVGLIIDRRCRK